MPATDQVRIDCERNLVSRRRLVQQRRHVDVFAVYPHHACHSDVPRRGVEDNHFAFRRIPPNVPMVNRAREVVFWPERRANCKRSAALFFDAIK